MHRIPVKFRVIQCIVQHEGISNLELLKILKGEYPRDRSINEKGVEDCLLSLMAVGAIELTGAAADREGRLKLCYKITDHGISLMKYIPCSIG